MTISRKDGNDTEFGNWLRTNQLLRSRLGFDGENLDYVWFAFLKGWFITIEEKRYGASPRPPQLDTHNVVRQMFEIASGSTIETKRGWRPIHYRGHYLIQFQYTNPNDSKWIKINGEEHNELDLLYLLKHGELISIDMDRKLPVLFKDKSVKKLGITKVGALALIYNRRNNNANV